MTIDGSVCIDTHSHWMPRVHLEAVHDLLREQPALLRDYGGMLSTAERPDAPLVALEGRIAEMDACGVDISVISLPPPAAAFGPTATARRVAAAANDAMLAAAERYPGRFSILLALPLPDIEGSLAELDRVSSHPLAQGVSALTNAETWTLDEPQFEAVWARAAQSRLPLVLHPAFDCRPAKFTDWTIGGSLHAVMSSSLGIARLVMSGMLDRVPTLDIVVPHLGGTIPYLAQRFVDMGRGDAEHDMAHYLRHRLYLDTCSYHPPAFRCALDTVGADRIVLGTDYPFRGSLERAVDDVIENAPTAEARAAILGQTASQWFSGGS
ncbi:MAG: amidohydrolase family protein [Acidimicrobiales bacterium]